MAGRAWQATVHGVSRVGHDLAIKAPPPPMKEGSRSQGVDFAGGAEVKTQHFHCKGVGSIPGWATKVPHAMWHGQKIKSTIK